MSLFRVNCKLRSCGVESHSSNLKFQKFRQSNKFSDIKTTSEGRFDLVHVCQVTKKFAFLNLLPGAVPSQQAFSRSFRDLFWRCRFAVSGRVSGKFQINYCKAEMYLGPDKHL